MNEFRELGLSEITIEALTKKGYIKPTTIQAQTIPILMKGKHDVIGQAQTGTGKTACFALPILENLKITKSIQALILTPTRELAVQVANEIKSLKGDRVVKIATIYGGASMRDQMTELERGVDIVVGTPGRIMDMMDRRKLDISEISFAVLDEADEMLNMGFVDDIKEILSKSPTNKKMLLFSATMPKEIINIAKKFMREYELVKTEGEALATALIDQVYYSINSRDRFNAIKRIIAVTPNFHGIIFCKTRDDVDMLADKLIGARFSAAALHGEVSQGQRENILRQFKDKKLSVLIATDVAARGIDVNDLNVVINYSLPQSPEMYVHRIGRTGRAGNKGSAITFLIPSEERKLRVIERIINQKIVKGKLPSVEDIMKVKKEKISTVINEMLKAGKTTEYDVIAKELVSGNDPEKVVSCILRYAFQNELDSASHKEIGVVNRSEGRSRDDRSKSNRGGRSNRSSRFGGNSGRSSQSGSRRFERKSSGSSRFNKSSEGGSSKGGSSLDRRKGSSFARSKSFRKSSGGRIFSGDRKQSSGTKPLRRR
jgi:ATP-dependent RNA helicase DeaD